MPGDHVDHLTAQWARERPDLDTRALAVAARVIRLERFLARGSARVLAEYDLNEGEFSVLTALRRAGAPYRLTPTDLYRALLLSSGAMTNRIDRLEERGLVRREADPVDRRRTLVELTDEGRRITDDAVAAHARAAMARFSALDEAERERLDALLRQVLLAIEE